MAKKEEKAVEKKTVKIAATKKSVEKKVVEKKPAAKKAAPAKKAVAKPSVKKAVPKDVSAKKRATKVPLRKLNTYDDFIDVEVDWKMALDYAYEHRKDEPYNEELFQKAMLDTLIWFASRPVIAVKNMQIFSSYDVELYTHIIEYVCYFARMSKDGLQDNGLMFSASQTIAWFYSHCLVTDSPTVILSQSNGSYQLIVHDNWLDDTRDFVYDFTSGDIQDFVEYKKLEEKKYKL